MEKNCKTQLWDEKQNRVLFLDHLAIEEHETNLYQNSQVQSLFE